MSSAKSVQLIKHFAVKHSHAVHFFSCLMNIALVANFEDPSNFVLSTWEPFRVVGCK